VRQVSFPERLERSGALRNAAWSSHDVQHLRLSMQSTLDAPTQARQRALVLLRGQLSAAELTDVMLMLSELVTNAVRHPVVSGGATVEVDMALAADCLRIDVRDGGDGFDVPAAAPSGTGGMGLMIVDAAATRWGMSDGLPHVVWFELEREEELASTG
jgi:two-component sensor histidine kinase